MSTIATSQIPAPKSWDEFEEIVLAVAKIRWKSIDFSRNGRSGQRQKGIDVFGTAATGEFVGVQVKNTIGGLSIAVIESEIEKAEGFEPAIEKLYIATTAPRDATVQDKVATISRDRLKAGGFAVGLLFWEDVSGDLASDPIQFFKFYPQFGGDRGKQHDKRLYETLVKILATNGVVGFLDQNNMAGFPFRDERLNPLREFYYNWNNPEREFLDAEIETIKQALWKKADEYLELIALETDSHGPDLAFRTVPQDWEIERPTHFREVVGKFHAIAGEIVELHQNFVRISKKRLYI